jgi:hypothetical protein
VSGSVYDAVALGRVLRIRRVDIAYRSSAETTLSLAAMAAPASDGRCVGWSGTPEWRASLDGGRQAAREVAAPDREGVPGTRRAHGRGDAGEQRRREGELAAEAPTGGPVAAESCTFATGRAASSALRVRVRAG